MSFKISVNDNRNKVIAYHRFAVYICKMLSRQPSEVSYFGFYRLEEIVDSFRSHDSKQWMLRPVGIPAREGTVKIIICSLVYFTVHPEILSVDILIDVLRKERTVQGGVKDFLLFRAGSFYFNSR